MRRSLPTIPTKLIRSASDTSFSSLFEQTVMDALRITPFTADAERSKVIFSIDAATEQIERVTGRALLTQNAQLVLGGWPVTRLINLGLTPVQSVTSIKYLDTDGIEQTVAPSNYRLLSAGFDDESKLEIDSKFEGVSTGRYTDAIKVSVVCGYGDDVSDVPASVRRLVMLLAVHFFENPAIISIGNLVTELPYSLVSAIHQNTIRPLLDQS